MRGERQRRQSPQSRSLFHFRENVDVPILANGNILSVEDVDRCIDETGVDGVMTAEGNLHNPAIFERSFLPLSWTLAFEYLDLVDQYPCPNAYIRGHLFKIFHHLYVEHCILPICCRFDADSSRCRLNLKRNASTRHEIAVSKTVEQFRRCVVRLRDAFEPYHKGLLVYDKEEEDIASDANPSVTYNLRLPPWVCQPYIRMDPDDHVKMLADKQKEAENPERVRPVFLDDDGNEISRKLMKKLRRSSRRPNAKGMRCKEERALPICKSGADCVNPMGMKCVHDLCRVCCRAKCFTAITACGGHKFFPRNKRRKLSSEIIE